MSDGLEGRHDVELGRRLHGLDGWRGGCRCRICRDAAAFAQRVDAASPAAATGAAAGSGPRWFVCRCGRRLYEHSMRTVPNTGGREYVCTLTPSGRAEPETGQDYGPETGLKERSR